MESLLSRVARRLGGLWSSRPKAVVVIDRRGRYRAFLLHGLRRYGYRVLQSLRPGSLRRRLLVLYALFAKVLLVTDNAGLAGVPNRRHRTVILNHDYFGAAGHRRQVATMPYFMHPSLYEPGGEENLLGLDGMPKDVLVSFAGTVDRRGYQDYFRFPLLDRYTIITAVRRHFSDRIQDIHSAADVTRLRPGAFAIHVNEVTPAGYQTTYALSRGDYLRLLARSKFVLCPPGWCMPFCHNIIEAMRLGAVPILNYATYLTPPLTPGRTCIGFSTEAELIDCIESVLADGEALYRDMGPAMRDWFRSYDNLDSLFGHFGDAKKPSIEVYVNSEEYSAEMLYGRLRSN